MGVPTIIKSPNKKLKLPGVVLAVSLLIPSLLLVSGLPASATCHRPRRCDDGPVSVPEPSSAWSLLVLGAGGAGLMLQRHLKRKQHNTENDKLK
jgi:hypothetical protein